MRNWGLTHVGDDGVTILLGNKVLDLGGRGVAQLVAANEVVGDFVLLGIRRLAVDVRHSPAGAVGCCDFGHDCGVCSV